MWGEIGDEFAARHKLTTNVFEAMRLHDGGHHLAVDGQRHIDMIALDERGPVLVAERMSEFYAGAHRDLWREMCQTVQMDNHNFTQAYTHRDGCGFARFPEQYVAIAHGCPPVERDR